MKASGFCCLTTEILGIFAGGERIGWQFGYCHCLSKMTAERCNFNVLTGFDRIIHNSFEIPSRARSPSVGIGHILFTNRFALSVPSVIPFI